MESITASTPSNTVYLRPPFYEFLSLLPKLGVVCASTANKSASLVRCGTYWSQWPGGREWRGGVSSSNVRLLMNRWRAASVESSAEHRGLRFMDEFGVLLHQVLLQDPSYFRAFDTVVASFASFNYGILHKTKRPIQKQKSPGVDITALCQAWDSIEYLGEFSGLLRGFGLSRTEALRCIGVERAAPVSTESVVMLLQTIIEERLALRVLVNSSGALQTHGSIFRSLHQEGDWLRLEKHHVSFQVNLKDIASAWVVKRPTQRGVVFSLEIFDANDNTIALFLYHGTADHPEYTRWKESLSRLPLSTQHSTYHQLQSE